MITNDYEWLWMMMNDDEWFWMIMNDYRMTIEWLWMILSDDGSLWIIMNHYEWSWMVMNDYEWLWMIMNDYEWFPSLSGNCPWGYCCAAIDIYTWMPHGHQIMRECFFCWCVVEVTWKAIHSGYRRTGIASDIYCISIIWNHENWLFVF